MYDMAWHECTHPILSVDHGTDLLGYISGGGAVTAVEAVIGSNKNVPRCGSVLMAEADLPLRRSEVGTLQCTYQISCDGVRGAGSTSPVRTVTNFIKSSFEPREAQAAHSVLTMSAETTKAYARSAASVNTNISSLKTVTEHRWRKCCAAVYTPRPQRLSHRHNWHSRLGDRINLIRPNA